MNERDPDRPLDGTDLKTLDARIRTVASEHKARDGTGKKGTGSSLGVAFRLSSEIVAAIGVGTGMGWVVDEFAGTRPWGMLLFFFLGCAAALKNVMRAMAELDADQRAIDANKTDRSESRGGNDGRTRS